MPFVPGGIVKSAEAMHVPTKIARSTRTKVTAEILDMLMLMKRIVLFLLQFMIDQRDWKGHLKSSNDYTTNCSATNASSDHCNSSSGIC